MRVRVASRSSAERWLAALLLHRAHALLPLLAQLPRLCLLVARTLQGLGDDLAAFVQLAPQWPEQKVAEPRY